jgi:hypothetical protein
MVHWYSGVRDPGAFLQKLQEPDRENRQNYIGRTNVVMGKCQKCIIEVGVFGTPDIYEEPFHRLDLVFTQPLINTISLKFTAGNLLDPEVKFTQGNEIQRLYKEGRSFSLGMSYSW